MNGVFRQTLNVNSKQTWLYENDSTYNGNDQIPGDGSARVFFDRSGGNAYSQGRPALHVGNGGDGQNSGTRAAGTG